MSPLFRVFTVRPQDGPPLPMGEQLYWFLQLQVFPAFPELRVLVLCVYCSVVVELLHFILA